MRAESLGLPPNTDETSFLDLECGDLNISDGMIPIDIPQRITKENYKDLFVGGLPDGLDPNIFEDGELELEQ
ncbi:MAG: hypothetical protein AAB869_03115 [Patescibacteria group bacterium]